MPENNKSADVVNREDYNKAVESANSRKAELEKKEKELVELKAKEEARKTKIVEKKKTNEEEKWKKEMEEKDKKIKELEEKKKVDDTPNPKGVVQQPTVPQSSTTQMLDERYGKDYKNSKDMSPIQRLIHFKSPTTQQYNSEKLGELLSLQASAQVSDPNSLPQRFHDAQRNNLVANEIKLPKK